MLFDLLDQNGKRYNPMKHKTVPTMKKGLLYLLLLEGSHAFLLPGNGAGRILTRKTKEAPPIYSDQETSPTSLNLAMMDLDFSSQLLSSLSLNIDREQAEALAGPFFGASLFPYLTFLYFLNVKENNCPKGVTVGFATCLLFVFLTIPAAIAAQVLYGVSLADSDWLHGSAESLLTITNLVTVIAFRQALEAKEKDLPMPESATSWEPMISLMLGLTGFAIVTAAVPAVLGPTVHTPYLAGFMDLPFSFDVFGANPEPENALTIATWIIHVSSLVEFLVAMGFAWRWADVVENPTWKGLTWGLLPLHSSGITACTYHLFFNRIPGKQSFSLQTIVFHQEFYLNFEQSWYHFRPY